jgi:glucosamine--fructose-6-phosphate aminotransferase (isomerizing)
MCGIVVRRQGRGTVSPSLLAGLKCLSPRGTDSAGIVLIEEASGAFFVEKVGERPAFAALEERLTARTLPTALVGMGHVRWATRGEVAERNAHPHLSPDGRFALVHNGNVDQTSLVAFRSLVDGDALRSETDSEVLVAAWARICVEAEARSTPIDARLFADFVARVQGTNVFVCLDRLHPERLFVGVTGVGELYGAHGLEGELVFASSPYVLMGVAETYVALAPGAYLFGSNETEIPGEPHRFDPGVQAPSAQGFAHIMQAELFHVPGAIRRVVDAYRAEPMRKRIGPSLGGTDRPDEIVFLACGTSLHAAEFLAPFFATRLGIPVRAIDATNVIDAPVALYGRHALVVAISQSGTTTDTLKALADCLAAQRGNDRRISTIGVHNNPMGALAHQVQTSFYTCTGEERATASTMAFFGQCAVLWLLLDALDPTSTEEMTTSTLKELLLLASQLERVREQQGSLVEVAERLVEVTAFKILALGSDVAIASEGALKLEEVVYCPSAPLPAGRLKHGPLALVPDKATILVLAPKHEHDPRYERLVGAIEDVRTRKGKVVVFTTEGNKDFVDRHVDIVTVPLASNLFAQGLLFAYALQLLSYHLGALLEREIDTPRNLAKTVTVQ